MGVSSSKETKEDDGYRTPMERKRHRTIQEAAAVLTDSDAAAFDPTADKYDYLIVFSNERPKRRASAPSLDEEEGGEAGEAASTEPTMTWSELEDIWEQVIPGEEDKKSKGKEMLESAWTAKFGAGHESATRIEVETLIRDHVIEVLSRRSGLQLKLSLSSSRTKQYCQVRAPISLLERKADALDYKLKFRPEVDPGPDFWRRTSGTDVDGRPNYVELKEEAKLYGKEEANEVLHELYKAGKIGPHDVAVFDDEEPTKKHWSRRVHTLERIADRVPVTNEFPAYASYDARARERHLYDEYQSVRGRTFFLAKDRLYLTKRIIDEVFDFGVLLQKELVDTVTALHDANYGEMPTADWFLKRWVFFWQAESDRAGAPYVTHYAILKHRRCPFLLRPWAQPLMEIRAYFGEKIALYFAWLGFYGFYLLYPAVAGFGCQLYDLATDTSDETEGIHPEQFVMAIFLVCWSAYYKEHWDIESQYCALKWGTVNFEEEEVDRPKFVGDADVPGGRRISPITNQMETYYPPAKRQRTQRQSILVIILFIVGLVVVIVFIFELEYLMLIQGGILASLSSAVGLAQAILIQVMSEIYGRVATAMNEAENYRTQTEYENQLVLKKFLFEIFNNYSALAITAYFKGAYFECTSGAVKQNCLGDLKALLESIFGTRFALALVSAFKEQIDQVKTMILPPDNKTDDVDDDENDDEDDDATAAAAAAVKKKEPADTAPQEAERFENELSLETYEGTFDDYAEIVLQMGLVSMFALGWYAVPALAILEVLLQIRVDAYKLTAQTRRPDPMPAESVGSWGLLMESMGLLAVYANAGIIVFTTRSFQNRSILERLLIFFALEQVALVLKFITHAAIDDVPTRLSDLKRRNDYVVVRHKIAVFDDDDDDDDDDDRSGGGGGEASGPGDREDVAASRGAIDSDLLSVAALRVDKLTKFQERRLEFLRRRLLTVDKDLNLLRSQYKVACRAEIFREDLGVSYSRKEPDLALGLLTVTVVEALGVGRFDDPVRDVKAVRVIAHVRDLDDPTASVGPPPQVSKPARKHRQVTEMDAGERLVFDQAFSLAPIKKARASLRLEIMEDLARDAHAGGRQRRRATADLKLETLLDQFPHKDLILPLAIIGHRDDGVATPSIKIHAHFQYSKIVPIKNKIFELLTEQKKLHRDVTRIQLNQETENAWDFPDLRNIDDDTKDEEEDLEDTA
ncbi:hypothetical protein CTAYLR_009104 [Chrysophaeum taylorii]|uniref:Anoctamin transmembrane domain-containing protein n=1 Tax=Chrysophaeum taylorii TaxID=2483200 RepID=A0AAD7XP48_9STRA|nr:hypothetical protein CTAYLR_009104 [Chrysophaeum taylorii]